MKNMKVMLRSLLCCALVLCLLLALVGCKKEETGESQATEPAATQPEPTCPPLAVTDTQEQEDWVVVTTSYCTLKFPFAFSDMLQVTAAAEEESLYFTAKLGDTEQTVFVIRFGGEGTVELGQLRLPVTEATVSVRADLLPLPEDLPQEHHGSYYAVQEVFNDVIASMAENENFTPVQ